MYKTLLGGRICLWAALLTFAVYTFCFLLILLINPPFSWTNWADFAAYTAANPQLIKYIGMGCMLIFACLLPIIFSTAVAGRSFGPGRLAELFSLAAAVCIGINYFVQLTATRLQLAAGQSEGLLQLTQSYNISAINAVNMLGWTVFLPLAALALALTLWQERAVRVGALLVAGVMLAGLVGYLLNHYLLLLITMNLGLGGSLLALLICLLGYFRRAERPVIDD